MYRFSSCFADRVWCRCVVYFFSTVCSILLLLSPALIKMTKNVVSGSPLICSMPMHAVFAATILVINFYFIIIIIISLIIIFFFISFFSSLAAAASCCYNNSTYPQGSPAVSLTWVHPEARYHYYLSSLDGQTRERNQQIAKWRTNQRTMNPSYLKFSCEL